MKRRFMTKLKDIDIKTEAKVCVACKRIIGFWDSILYHGLCMECLQFKNSVDMF